MQGKTLNLLTPLTSGVGRFFLAVPRGCVRFVTVVFPDHTLLLFLGLKVRCKYTFFIKQSTKTYSTGGCYDLNDTEGELQV